MPRGIPVATFAIGDAGASNAALFAIAALGAEDTSLRTALVRYREEQSARVQSMTLPAHTDK